MLGSPLMTVMTEAQISANNKMTGKLNEASNRTNEKLERGLNMQKGIQKDAFVQTTGALATVGATVGVAKSETAQNVLSQSFKPIKDAFCNTKFGKSFAQGCQEVIDLAKPALQEGVKWVKNLPKPAKAILGIGTALTAIASNIVQTKTQMKDSQIVREHGIKQGRIQEQYK